MRLSLQMNRRRSAPTGYKSLRGKAKAGEGRTYGACRRDGPKGPEAEPGGRHGYDEYSFIIARSTWKCTPFTTLYAGVGHGLFRSGPCNWASGWHPPQLRRHDRRFRLSSVATRWRMRCSTSAESRKLPTGGAPPRATSKSTRLATGAPASTPRVSSHGEEAAPKLRAATQLIDEQFAGAQRRGQKQG